MPALLLAGGASRRMGTDKAALPWPDGRSWLEVTAATLREVAAPVVVAGRTDELPEGLVGVPDAAVAAGPLGGIVAGLRYFREHGSDGPVVVVACDAPLIEVADLMPLLEVAGAGGAVSYVDGEGRRLPLPAVLHQGALGLAEARLESGDRSLHGFLDAAGAAREPAGGARLQRLSGANTAAERAALERYLRTRSGQA